MTNFEIAKTAGLVFLASSAIFVLTNWQSTRLPIHSAALFPEPSQTALNLSDASPFTTRLQGHRYNVTPRFAYQLRGIVVSLSETSSWKNITHAKAGDLFNTNDICVIWGSNAETLNLRDFDFWSGDWTCYVRTNSSEAWRAFDPNALSNTHVLPSTPEVRKALARVRVGDHIEATGRLVDYSTDGGPIRKSSVVRTDRENGACEVMYVSDFKILKRPNQVTYKLSRVSGALAALSCLIALAAFFILPFVRKHD